jgi:TM2 domain-containing membrane protein YozV
MRNELLTRPLQKSGIRKFSLARCSKKLVLCPYPFPRLDAHCYMRPSSTILLKWVLLLAVGSLGGCQRAAYQFQNSIATYQMPPAAPETSALVRLPRRSLPTEPLRALPRQEPRIGRTQRAPLHLLRTGSHRQLPTAKLPPRKAEKVSASFLAGTQLQQEPLPKAPVRWRSRGIALILALLLGSLGAHLFYLGYTKRGILYLLLSMASILLLSIAAVLFITALFSSSGVGFLVFGVVALILASAIGVLALVDTIFILTDDLKPKDGEYYPRFFQTRPRP